ncbi:MAG TPA: DUF1302 family protein [Nevskiaceae bacterium]|nr:DUF1302 family protein [Nevskiaceae bacterium]
MLPPSLRGRVATSLALAALALPSSSFAITIDIGDGAVTGALNSTVTLGAAWRMQGRDQDLIGKANLNPDVCYGHQSCQGVFRDQIEPAQTLVHAPGQFSVNNDDGDLNYDKHHLVQAVAKLTQDVTLSWHDFGLFARWMYFYDAENNDFTEYHPNRITSGNYQNVGIGPNDRSFVNTADPVTSQVLRAVYFPGQRIYGPGGVVRNKRTDGQTLQQIGTNFQMLDAVLSGKFPLPGDHTLTVKIGRQTVSWGESTLLVINSLNQANPVNANNLYRVGYQLEEVFTPVNMAFASFEPFTNATIQGFYQFEWEPLQTPTPGSYFSFIDVGTDNVGKTVSVSFGGNAEDPESYGHPQENPLALITPTTLTIERLPDHNARNSGQYGVNFSYYFENLGNGTQMGLYFMNYHSKLPYASFYATHASCARREGNSMGIDATNSLQWLLVCNDMPLNRELTLGDPRAATSDNVPLDTAKLQLEYPEDIKLYGWAFNTTIGDFSFQGEVAYRPRSPLQVDTEDLAFAAFGPTLTRCHEQSLGCSGSSDGSIGIDGRTHGNSNFVDGAGNNPYPDTFDAGVPTTALLGIPGLTLPGNLPSALVLGHIPGSARAFPNFIIPYRGGQIGENAPCYAQGDPNFHPYNAQSPCYIRGWEYFQTLQYNLGATYILGASDNPFGADQLIMVGELGATHVLDLPSWDVLQIEAPGTTTHASAGADGSGADGGQRACSTNPSCSIGPDGLRFNPTQQKGGWAESFAWGYRLIFQFKYESVLPGISLMPQLIWMHDVKGTAPGPAENFDEGRKNLLATIETRYKESLSFTVGYGWWTGGGNADLYSDRDFAQVFVKYQF